MFKMDGFDELSKKLEDMQQAAQELENTEDVSVDELFDRAFMKEHTSYSLFEEFLSEGNFKVETTEDLEAIPKDELDQHTAKTTKFNNWEDMLNSAGKSYATKKLGF